MMRPYTILVATSFLLISSNKVEATHDDNNFILVEGTSLVGGTNGMAFDDNDDLWVTQALGCMLSKINPESGEVLEEITVSEGAIGPDDIAIAGDGIIYWTNVLIGNIMRHNLTDGVSTELFPPMSYPWNNPLALNDDDSKLYFAQCFYTEGPNGVYEYDVTTEQVTEIVGNIPLCASNGMDYYNGSLYGPRVFEGSILEYNFQNDVVAVTEISTGLLLPTAVSFNSKGELYGVVAGAVYQFMMTANGNDNDIDASNDLRVVAKLPFWGVDNLAFDSEDRLFVSSFTEGTVLEVMLDQGVSSSNGYSEPELRTVVEGGLPLASGVAVVDDVVYTVTPLALFCFDKDTGKRLFHQFEGMPGTTPGFVVPNNVIAFGDEDDEVGILSFFGGLFVSWNTEMNRPGEVIAQFPEIVDAMSFQDGLMVVVASGEMIYAFGENLEFREFIATLPSPGGGYVAGNDENVYVSIFSTGSIYQVIKDGETLEAAKLLMTGLSFPEGIALVDDGDSLLILLTGSGELVKMSLLDDDAEATTIEVLAEGLTFFPPLPDILPFGYSDKVVVDEEYIYFNSINSIHKIALDKEESPDDDEEPSDDSSFRTRISALGAAAFVICAFILL